MIDRRHFLKGGLSMGLLLSLGSRSSLAAIPATDATFLIINDVHSCRMGSGLSANCAAEGKTDAALLRHIRALNSIIEQTWPLEINGKATGLASAGEPIARPLGIVVSGDVTDDGGGQTAELGEGAQLLQFSHRYQEGNGLDRVHFPVYVGLGNHDLDQDGRPPHPNWYRDELRDYVRLNHKPSAFFKPPYPADNYDEGSDCYSWNWGGLHLIMAQRFAGDTNKGAASALGWLKNDLAMFAADGRPVVIFQHYGWDPFSLERWDPEKKTFDDQGSGAPHWWSDADRRAFLDILKGYNIAAIVHGHEHDSAMIYQRAGFDIIKPTAAYKGGFGVIRITDKVMDVVLGEAAGDNGGVQFLAAFSKGFG
ncbi:cytolysin (calcineurin-like family phosphatase) [Pararhizobium capsulatum DSM 1112]|uniref:Cytolysin (Calcineurin-like family phosphatase) n=1 Tax=Pararhizobium capsulatum DSM 1112 TaxID=1121113 RepID=A0ABU0BRR3_9HYPH|nr:metallophosphoesterase [Pararhizobium capsulatum]MDQ0320938.1 cytolysin (calcineurin-like family phosphatase) [Pararhizobium capsulatum DSM 1112]